MKAPRLVLLALSGVTLMAVTACSPVGDAAVKVDGITYSSHDVDLFTKFECTYLSSLSGDPQAAGQVPALSRQNARSLMASILVTSALDKLVAKKAKIPVDSTQVQSTLDGIRPAIDKAARGEDRDRLIALITESIEGQTAIQTAVVQQIGESTLNGMGDQAQQAVQQAVQQVRQSFAKTADIDVDPSYGLSPDGLTADNDASLSKPVSSFAKDATAQTPAATWLSSLPTAQRCS